MIFEDTFSSVFRKVIHLVSDQKRNVFLGRAKVMIVRSPFRAKHHVPDWNVPYPLPPARPYLPLTPSPPLQDTPPPQGQHDWQKTRRTRKNWCTRKNWWHYWRRKGLRIAVALSTACCYNTQWWTRSWITLVHVRSAWAHACPEWRDTPSEYCRKGRTEYVRGWISVLVVCCSDITNTLVGISGETVPEGGNLRIYWPLFQWCHLWAVVLTFETGVSHHTPPPPGGAGLYSWF